MENLVILATIIYVVGVELVEHYKTMKELEKKEKELGKKEKEKNGILIIK